MKNRKSTMRNHKMPIMGRRRFAPLAKRQMAATRLATPIMRYTYFQLMISLHSS